MIVIAQMNHIDQPFYLHIKNNKLIECYQDTESKMPSIFRPKDQNGETLDAVSTLGCCLGFTLLMSKLENAPDTFEVTLAEEEEVCWPPTLLLMQLDGTVKYWQCFYTKWKNVDLLAPVG